MRADASLKPHLNESGTWLDGKPGTDRLVEARWHAVQTWAAHWLDSHADAAPDALAKAGEVFGKDEWHFSATSLGHGDILVSAAKWQFGTAFILGRSGTRGYRLRWSIAAPQARLNRTADRRISYWRPAHCRGDCWMMGVSGTLRLPDDAGGAARFSINAGYARETGATGPMQLSLWSWQHGRARPLLVHDYTIMAEQRGGGVRGAILHLPSKGQWNTLSACGGCYGRETDLRFAIEPNRVRMLPPVSRTPEIDLIDRVFSRLFARRPVDALAAPSAVRVIRRQLADRLAETDPQLKGYAGMPMGWGRWRTRGQRWACLSIDGAGATAFAFDANRTRITEARVLKPNSCEGEGTRN